MDYIITYYSQSSNKLFMIDWFSLIPLFLSFKFSFLKKPAAYLLSESLQFCGRSYRDQSLVRCYTAFDLLIYKNHSRFKKCFNIASTTDEHIHFIWIITQYVI